MSSPIELVAQRIGRLSLREGRGFGKIGQGPVLSVVRNIKTGQIYVGFNEGGRENISDVLSERIREHQSDIANAKINIVRSDPKAAEGGHSEINALNPAIRDYEKIIGRKLTENDLHVFELHNLWIEGRHKLTTKGRCEHCARLTRGIRVTQSLFIAEAVANRSISGSTLVPQRGLVIPAGGRVGMRATTVSGEINDSNERGSVIRAGNRSGTPVNTVSGEINNEGIGRAVATNLAGIAIIITERLIERWYIKTYIQPRWKRQEHEYVVNAIKSKSYIYNILIISKYEHICREKSAGRSIRLRFDVDTYWIDTDYGPAMMNAELSYYDLLFEGDTEIEWPKFRNSFARDQAWIASGTASQRDTYYYAL